MKPFFLLFLMLLSGCVDCCQPFLSEDPRSAMISVSLRFPDGQNKTLEVENFSRLEQISEVMQCAVCDLSGFNPHLILKDGDVIVLRPKAGLTVSLNQASVTDLMFLPGIGEVLAKRIIDYRNQHGFYQHVEEVMLVRGIKVGLFSRIKPYLVL
jgi:competence protein ComEA